MVNALVNFAQLCDVFVCDVVMIINENMPRWSPQTLWIILLMICFEGSMHGLMEITCNWPSSNKLLVFQQTHAWSGSHIQIQGLTTWSLSLMVNMFGQHIKT
jgi:hypothetical protein